MYNQRFCSTIYTKVSIRHPCLVILYTKSILDDFPEKFKYEYDKKLHDIAPTFKHTVA